MKLYEIANDFAILFEALESYSEEEDPATREALEEAWFNTLDGIEAGFEVKAESVAQYIKTLKASAAAVRAEEKALAARRKTMEKHAERLTAYLMGCMQAVRRNKIETPLCRISLRNNAESVSIPDEIRLVEYLQAIDRDDLLRYKDPEIDRTAVKDFLQSGGMLEGAFLVRTQSLVIK